MATTRRPRIAIAACRADDDAGPRELYPDADWPLLAAALTDAGADTTAIAWDCEDLDWQGFDLVLVNSTWDSVDRPDEYLSWVRRTARSTTLLNPGAAIGWNLDKSYLRRLEARGVPVVPTEWVTDGAQWTPPPYDFVVKPSISAGGRETARYQPGDGPSAAAHVGRLLDSGQTVMVQPYLSTVESEGEIKMVFIEGEFSHAVRVGPLLGLGSGVVDRPWERFVPMEAVVPTSAQFASARAVLAALKAEPAVPLLYARVDLVAAPTGQPLLGEVELVDPSLFLRFAPPSAVRYAEAITARARQGMRRA